MAITLIEFAIILFIKQNYGKSMISSNIPCTRLLVATVGNEMVTNQPEKARINVSEEPSLIQQTSSHYLGIEPTAAIDRITCVIFLCSYFIFNLAYILIYIQKK